MRVLWFFTFAALSAFPATSFQIHQSRGAFEQKGIFKRNSGQSLVSRTALNIVPELGATDLAVALASAAAGAVAQIPRINELEEQKKKLEADLNRANEALSSVRKTFTIIIPFSIVNERFYQLRFLLFLSLVDSQN